VDVEEPRAGGQRSGELVERLAVAALGEVGHRLERPHRP
jgi:hypothetical protein